MTKTVTVQARMEPKLKEQADAILASLGMNATTAITLFYTQMVQKRGIPFELKVPNDELLPAIAESKDPEFLRNTKRYHNAAEIFADPND
jgi:addiction module RelB/DinJ family antitoxin